MSHTIKNQSEFTVVGIPLRTSNDTAMQEIGVHWQKFYATGVLGNISDKANDSVVALYTDYESDHTKPYTLILGARVNHAAGAPADMPEDMIAKKIPAAKYAVFPVTGEMPAAIPETWMRIWNTELDRTYVGDFELYENQPSGEMAVSIYVGVR